MEKNLSFIRREPVDSATENQLVQYLKRKEAVFSKFHPQWDLTNEEISSSSDLLKRDGTPICIPPSWDLAQRYVGPENKEADGFDRNIFNKKLNLFTGDRSEADFLDVMRNTEIGGILIGDIHSKDLLNANFSTIITDFNQPIILREFLQKAKEFEIDFLHFHQSGILHFEIKTSKSKNDDEKTQIKNQRDILKKLFKTFCQLIGKEFRDELWDCFFRQSLIVYMNHTDEQNDTAAGESTLEQGWQKIWGKEGLKKWLREHDWLLSKNHFEDEVYRNFLLFLAGYRPDYFISPVKCSLVVKDNIFSHHANIINYYKNNDHTKVGIHNKAKNVTEFLSSLTFLKCTDIDFGEYKNIYLTEKQVEAIGFFDDSGNFSPKRQMIFGPPGSGKSLILMVKIFILGQMETRKERKVYYSSRSEHEKKLTDFVSRNKSKFCREVKNLEEGFAWYTLASEGGDAILDEERGEFLALDCLSSQHEDQIVAVVCTGLKGNVTSRNQKDEYETVDYTQKFKKRVFLTLTDWTELESRGFRTTELQTVFRSTRQIQSFFHKFHPVENKRELISGHNFDGTKVEEWIFDGEEKLKKALNERIQRLIQIEGCKAWEIGLFLPRRRYEKLRVINNIFDDYHKLRSLEFPVMIVVEPEEDDIYLSLSRAVCHLIIFTTIKKSKILEGRLPSSAAELQSM